MTSTPPSKSSSNNRDNGHEQSLMTRMKNTCISFTSSLQEGLRYIKASLVGQANQMTARDEKEASEAELKTAKMQVEATNAAEDTKKRLEM